MSQHEFYLTSNRLRANGACTEQVELFVRTFGPRRKVMLNDENFEKAVKARLQIWWLAYRYLGEVAYAPLDGDDFGADYEKNARRYWKAIKAKLAKDKAKRPPEWY